MNHGQVNDDLALDKIKKIIMLTESPYALPSSPISLSIISFSLDGDQGGPTDLRPNDAVKGIGGPMTR